MSNLTLKDEQFAGGLAVITVQGELDANTSAEFDALVTRLIDGGASKLLVDIDGVTYIASAGVGVFVGNVQSLRDRGGDLALVYSKYVDPEDTGTGLTEGLQPARGVRHARPGRAAQDRARPQGSPGQAGMMMMRGDFVPRTPLRVLGWVCWESVRPALKRPNPWSFDTPRALRCPT